MDGNRVEESEEVEDVMEQVTQEMETEVKEVEIESEVAADKTEVAADETELADEKTEVAAEENEAKAEDILAEKIVEETDDDDCGFIESKEFVNKSSLKEETKEKVQVENVGKKKIKEEKPPTKVIIRNLPPAMTEKEFSEAISPIPAYDFFYYVKAEQTTDRSLQSYSRAYINFIDPDNVHFFYDTFDNYVFVDSKGYEYPAQVELAPYQKIQRKNRRRDKIIGLIETDQSYITFKEMYELESSETVANKQHFLETEIAPVEEITTTPLIEFMKQKRAEKARLKDEKREERKRKENERRQKQQKFREKREGDEEVAKDIKVLAPPKDRKDSKEGLPKTKKYEEKDKSKEIRTREFKNKSYDKNERKKFGEKKGDENDDKEDKPKFRRGQNRHENDETQDKEKYSKKDDYYKKSSRHDDERRPHRYKDDRPSKPTARSQKFLNSKKTDLEAKDDSKVDKKLDNKEKEERFEGKEVKNEEKDKGAKEIKLKKKDEKEFQSSKESKNENSSNEKEAETKQDRKDPRTNRRIRNKDRPSIEIYRPGMGKFSKQKKQGSTDQESPSHSPPPSNDAKSSSD